MNNPPETVCVPLYNLTASGPIHAASSMSSPFVVIRNIKTAGGEQQKRDFGMQFTVPIFDTWEDYVAWRDAPLEVGDYVKCPGWCLFGTITKITRKGTIVKITVGIDKKRAPRGTVVSPQQFFAGRLERVAR